MKILVLGLIVSSISWNVTQEELFKDFRDWICAWSKNKSLAHKKCAYLFTCYYCFAHYVALGVYLMFNEPVYDSHIIGYFCLLVCAHVELTLFNLLRVVLRWIRAKANTQEAIFNTTKNVKVATNAQDNQA